MSISHTECLYILLKCNINVVHAYVKKFNLKIIYTEPLNEIKKFYFYKYPN